MTHLRLLPAAADPIEVEVELHVVVSDTHDPNYPWRVTVGMELRGDNDSDDWYAFLSDIIEDEGYENTDVTTWERVTSRPTASRNLASLVEYAVNQGHRRRAAGVPTHAEAEVDMVFTNDSSSAILP